MAFAAGWFPRLVLPTSGNWAYRCNECANCDTEGAPHEEIQVTRQVRLLSSDGGSTERHYHKPLHSLTQSDSFDITFTPRSLHTEEFDVQPLVTTLTPRQRDLRGQLDLPVMAVYPVPPHCNADEAQEFRYQRLLDMYQGFALELHTGMYLTQLMADRSYSDIHCQLVEDMATLKLDQSNGRIIEFPLANVSKAYRLIKNGSKWYPAESPAVAAAPMEAESICVVVFCRRKLAFVFKESRISVRFLLCLELLIWRAQQRQGLPLLLPTLSSPLHNSHPGGSGRIDEYGAPGISPRIQQGIGGQASPRPDPRIQRTTQVEVAPSILSAPGGVAAVTPERLVRRQAQADAKRLTDNALLFAEGQAISVSPPLRMDLDAIQEYRESSESQHDQWDVEDESQNISEEHGQFVDLDAVWARSGEYVETLDMSTAGEPSRTTRDDDCAYQVDHQSPTSSPSSQVARVFDLDQAVEEPVENLPYSILDI